MSMFMHSFDPPVEPYYDEEPVENRCECCDTSFDVQAQDKTFEELCVNCAQARSERIHERKSARDRGERD